MTIYSCNASVNIDQQATMPLDEGSKKVIDELRSGKYQLEPDQFYEVWEMFDKTGTGKIKVEDVEDCVRRLLSCINIPSFSPYQ